MPTLSLDGVLDVAVGGGRGHRLRVARESIPLHVELDDALVRDQTAFERRRIALIDLVRGDIELLDRRIVTDVLGETLAEHVSEQVGCQVDLF